MNLSSKRRIVSDLLNVGKDRVWFDEERSEDIKSAITREDLRGLIHEGAIKIKQKQGVSRFRAKKIAKQKAKGRRKGVGSRKGKPTARLSRKETWMIKIRSLRKFLVSLRDGEVITQQTYAQMRRKAKSDLFRSKRHAKLYLEDKNLFIKKEKK
jgi:large subunit ribosomal protein L19e